MKRWPWRKILTVLGSLLVIVGVAPLGFVLWESFAHNYQPLSMPFPLKRGHYVSAVFKTDLDEPYVIQMEFLSPSGRAVDLNPAAVLDVDWQAVNANGAVLKRGFQNSAMSWANAVNLGEIQPKRGEAERIILDINQDLEEPEGSRVTLEVNSTEDPEGRAFAYFFAEWLAIILAVPGLILLVALFILQKASLGRSARTP